MNNLIPIQNWSVPTTCLEYQSLYLQLVHQSRSFVCDKICVKVQSSQVNTCFSFKMHPLFEYPWMHHDSSPLASVGFSTFAFVREQQQWHLWLSVQVRVWVWHYQSLYTKGMHRFRVLRPQAGTSLCSSGEPIICWSEKEQSCQIVGVSVLNVIYRPISTGWPAACNQIKLNPHDFCSILHVWQNESDHPHPLVLLNISDE